jgi:hypothetical protein
MMQERLLAFDSTVAVTSHVSLTVNFDVLILTCYYIAYICPTTVHVNIAFSLFSFLCT